jgi:hypothetical protein
MKLNVHIIYTHLEHCKISNWAVKILSALFMLTSALHAKFSFLSTINNMTIHTSLIKQLLVIHSNTCYPPEANHKSKICKTNFF